MVTLAHPDKITAELPYGPIKAGKTYYVLKSEIDKDNLLQLRILVPMMPMWIAAHHFLSEATINQLRSY